MTAAVASKPATAATTLIALSSSDPKKVDGQANMDVINHLLFHKALIADDDDGSRINKYLEFVHEGEHVTISDVFDRSIALAFELVLQEHLNPWDLDLVRFSQMYLERAQEEKIDLVTAGRIVLLAWTVLKLQSDDLVRRTLERRDAEEEEMSWEDMPDFDFSDDEVDFTERVRLAPRAPIDEKVHHQGDRKVTLMELLDAFEVARTEAAKRSEIAAARRVARRQRSKTGRANADGRVHGEDLEADLAEVWSRISGLNGDAIPLRRIHAPNDLDDFVTVFSCVLFLHRDRRIRLWQEAFPHGEVFVQNLTTSGGGDE